MTNMKAVAFAIGLIVTPVVASAVTGDRTQLFVTRVADNGASESAKITVGALPRDWTPPVPLPSVAPLLGSLQHPRDGSTQLFYAPPDVPSAYAAYVAELQQAGYVATSTPAAFWNRGGFEESSGAVPLNALYCHGPQGLDILVPQRSSDDLRVNVLPSGTGMMNSCARRTPEIGPLDFPLPVLTAPNGVTVTHEGSGSASYGTGPAGASGSESSEAFIRGKTSPSQLLDRFQVQFVAAGWHVTEATRSTHAAFASYEYGEANERWNAFLAIYAAGPRAFHAAVVASGIPSTHLNPVREPSVPQIPIKLSKTMEPALVQLTQRVLRGESQDVSNIYLHKSPPDLPRAIPLPHGMLVGSTVVVPLIPAESGDTGRDTLYYRLTRPQLTAYERALHDGGWTPTRSRFEQRGFVSPPEDGLLSYCKTGLPLFSTYADASSNDVTIDIPRNIVSSNCHDAVMPFTAPERQLPKLVAPSAVVSQWTVNNAGTSASFRSSSSPSQLLESFGAQLKSAGWSTLSATSNDTLGSATFTQTKGATKMQAAITIYRQNPTSSVYNATLDAEPLSNAPSS